MMNLKDLWIAGAALMAIGACAVGERGSDAPATAGTEQAVTGDFADMASRNGWTGLTGNSSFPEAVIGMKVKSGDFGTLETMVQAESGISCTRANSCLKIVSTADNQTGYPTTTDQGELEKVAEAISGLLLNGSAAPILFVDGTAADATNLNASYQTAIAGEFLGVGKPGAGVVTQTYTIASGSQGTVTTFLAATGHTGIVAVVPNGFLASSLAVQVGGTQDNGSGVDIKWTTADGGDVMALEHNLPFPTGAGKWASSPKDSPYFTAAAIASRLNQQAGAPATRAVLLAAAASHFTAITGSGSTLGIFKDGSSL